MKRSNALLSLGLGTVLGMGTLYMLETFNPNTIKKTNKKIEKNVDKMIDMKKDF